MGCCFGECQNTSFASSFSVLAIDFVPADETASVHHAGLAHAADNRDMHMKEFSVAGMLLSGCLPHSSAHSPGE